MIIVGHLNGRVVSMTECNTIANEPNRAEHLSGVGQIAGETQ
jgi:hypothetical protein